MHTNSLYIFTGGPGSGKTTTLDALAALGYNIIPEVGRAIIQHQIQEKGEALPWQNKQLFFELMFEASLADYTQQIHPLAFFDRGLPDSMGYAKLENLFISTQQRQIAQQTSYAFTVFIFPPWEAIYTQDKERKQDFNLAVQTCNTMRETYALLGYSLVDVPCTTLEKRVEFILDYLHLNK